MSRGSVVEDRNVKSLRDDVKGPSSSGDSGDSKSKGTTDTSPKCSKHMAC
jgi:hypothetical protein